MRSRRRSPRRRRFPDRTSPAARPPRRTTSGCRRVGWSRSSCEPLQIGEPDLDERTDRILETCLSRDRERLVVGLPDLLGGHALLEPVVARDEQLLDALACLVGHRGSVTPLRPVLVPWRPMPWLQISAVIQVLLAAGCVTLVLMHSGREAGMGGLGFTPHSQGGTHVVERNLTRVTVVAATLFGINTLVLFHLL